MGCQIGGLLQKAGHDVTFIARGRQLAALQSTGLSLTSSAGEHWQGAVRAVAHGRDAGVHDAVLLTTKSYQLPDTVEHLPPMMDDATMIVPAVNGIPWWYFQQHGGEFDGRHFASLDPEGILARSIEPVRIIGCVNYLAGSLVAPGEITYVPELQRRLHIGELDGSISPRLQRLGAALNDAGFGPVLSESIRTSIWHKLWGNISFNPISALTHGTIDQIAEGYRDIDLVSAVMNEARFIADKLGIELSQTIKARVDAAAKMRGHKTSMLQDMEAGRATEIEAIVGVVREIGKWLEVSTPYLNALYSLVKLKEIFYFRGLGQA
jgi:2-dehydropantoate 2-reductase